jgi:3-dehydroquinate synthase
MTLSNTTLNTLGHNLQQHSPAEEPPININFFFAEQSMPITLGQDVHQQCIDFCAEQKPDRIFFIADAYVWQLYGQEIVSRYGEHFLIDSVLVKSSEQEKTLELVNHLLETAMNTGVTRRSIIVAMGGGLTGNIAGMVAGLLYRGIPLVHLPTSFLAMSDSILSLKQAVNGRAGKNLFGMYYLPVASFVCVNMLRTLPQLELIAGINELVKNCLVLEAQKIERLLSLINQPQSYANWIQLVILGIEAKQKLLLHDANEKSMGISLEYGHTVGHALEYQGYNLSHGIAVGLGMLVASAISWQRGWLNEQEYWLHYQLLHDVNSHLQFPPDIDLNKTIQIIRRDNKHGYLTLSQDQHPFVLLRSIGNVGITDGIPLAGVAEHEIIAAIKQAQKDIQQYAQRSNCEQANIWKKELMNV